MTSPDQPASGNTFKLMIGDLDTPFAEVTRYDHALPAQLRPVQLDPSVVTAIRALLQSLPSVAGVGAQAAATTYTLTFAPAVAAQLQMGTATLMPALNGGMRAIAVDASGRILGNGTLVAAQGLSSATSAIMIWQVLALITAQYYLHDMQQQMHAIKNTIKDLENTLLAKELALLVSHERYLQRTVNMVQRGAVRELDLDAISGQLEHMERECDQVQELMRQLMERQGPRIEKTLTSELFQWEVRNNIAAAQTYIDEFDLLSQGFVASVRVKTMIATVRSYLFHQTQISLARLKEANEDGQRGRMLSIKFYERIITRYKDAQADTDMFNLLSGLRKRFISFAAKRWADSRTRFIELNTHLSAIECQISAINQHLPPTILIQLDAEGNPLLYALPDGVGGQAVG